MKCNYCVECINMIDEDTDGDGYCACFEIVVNCADEACNMFSTKEDA